MTLFFIIVVEVIHGDNQADNMGTFDLDFLHRKYTVYLEEVNILLSDKKYLFSKVQTLFHHGYEPADDVACLCML